MTSIRPASLLFRFRTKFELGVDISRLTEDAHHLIFSRGSAVGVDSRIWGIQHADFVPHHADTEIGELSVKVFLNLNEPHSFVSIQAVVAIVMDTLRSFGDPHLQGISIFVPSAALTADSTSGGAPLWSGSEDGPGNRQLTATVSVDALSTEQLSQLIDRRVRGTRMLRFEEPEVVSVPDQLRRMASTDPFELSLVGPEAPTLTTSLKWPVTIPVTTPEAGAWVLALLVDALSKSVPKPNLALDVRIGS